MAASFDANLIPITVNTPKSMMKINGKRIIERTFEILAKAEIEEIFVITGYSSDVFDIIKPKYPNATFISIERYSEASTVAAVMPIKEFIKNAYVIDGGILINNPDIIRKYEYGTSYMGTYVESTNKWCYDVERDIVRGIKSVVIRPMKSQAFHTGQRRMAETYQRVLQRLTIWLTEERLTGRKFLLHYLKMIYSID